MSRGGEYTMVVGSSQVGKIIGRKGANIRELEADTGARIKISKEEHEPGMKAVDIHGSPEQIDRAKCRIESLFSNDFEEDRRGGGGAGFGSFGGDDFGNRRRERGGGFCSGFGGGRRDDRRGYGGGGRREDGGDRWGGKDDFQRGGGGVGRRGFNEDSESDSMYVDSQEVGKIIGRGGSRIRDMETQSGCQIKVSRDSDSRGCCEVCLRGSLEQIVDAKRLIGECL